jgi:hypothetical protein
MVTMFTKSTLRQGLLTLLLAAGVVVPAPASATVANAAPVSYVAAFRPTFQSTAIPHTGTMQLTIQNGTLTGTYTGISVMPDRFDNRIVSVTGAVSGNRVLFSIGNTLSFNGTLDSSGALSGTATMNGILYTFVAERGVPGGGNHTTSQTSP